MPEVVEGKKVFTLLEVATSIQKTLAARYTSSFWVKAEMNKLNHYPHSGHCYPELVDKVDGKVVAQFKSNLWRDDYLRINQNFLSLLGSPLKDGVKILFCARITFDPVYGLALRIIEIDPVFSLGELEREKQESIAKLKGEGVFDHNRSLPFPLLPQRLAIISVETSKGYADFNKIIDTNPSGYKFFHMLFPSLLAGDRAAESIRYQLSRIRKVVSHFDIVAIIRGGGGEVGLSCFNDYALSREIALFPIPVLTGIGHATNETVAELVSYKNAITPTGLAEYLLQRFQDFEEPVLAAERVIVQQARQTLADESQTLFHLMKYFRSVTGHVLIRSGNALDDEVRNLSHQVSLKLQREKQYNESLPGRIRRDGLSMCRTNQGAVSQSAAWLRRAVTAHLRQEGADLSAIAKAITHMHPDNVLKRGYSITRLNGQVVTDATTVNAGDQLETEFYNGRVRSTVDQVTKTADDE